MAAASPSSPALNAPSGAEREPSAALDALDAEATGGVHEGDANRARAPPAAASVASDPCGVVARSKLPSGACGDCAGSTCGCGTVATGGAAVPSFALAARIWPGTPTALDDSTGARGDAFWLRVFVSRLGVAASARPLPSSVLWPEGASVDDALRDECSRASSSQVRADAGRLTSSAVASGEPAAIASSGTSNRAVWPRPRGELGCVPPRDRGEVAMARPEGSRRAGWPGSTAAAGGASPKRLCVARKRELRAWSCVAFISVSARSRAFSALFCSPLAPRSNS